MKWPGFVGGTYISQSPEAANERTVNFYVENIESGGTVKRALFPTPGVAQLQTRTTGAGRANFFQNGRHFLVIGSEFLEADSTGGVFTLRGTVAVDSNPATISGNGDIGGQLFITSGGNGYVYDLAANILNSIAFLAGKATMGDFLGGYFLALDASTSTLWISDLNDGTVWDPTQFIQRSGAADNWVSMKVNTYIYLFGNQTSEVWFNSGAFPIPFELHPSGRIPHGCGAAFSPEVVGNSLYWFGATKNGHASVLRTPGFSVETVSDFSTHYIFDSMPVVSDAIGDSYEEFGHTFYILTFPTSNATWAFDASTSIWAERSTWSSARFAWEAWRPIFHAFAFGRHVVLDLRGPGMYELSTNYTSDVDNSRIRRLRRPPVVMNENKRMFFNRIELFVECGIARTLGLVPRVMMRASNDGGKTWSNERMRSLGAIGEYGQRVFWPRCGSGRRRTFEFIFSDDQVFRVLDAFVEVEAGMH